MPLPVYTEADYGAQLQKLLPRGRAWPREPTNVQTKTCEGLGGSFATLHADANGLVVDAFPATAVDLLPEWQETLGLVASGSIETQQAAVVTKLEANGGSSIPYFIGLAASLGFAVTITVYRPMRVNDVVNYPMNGVDSAFRWTVTTSTPGNHSILEATFRQFAPAHTVVDFVYT